MAWDNPSWGEERIANELWLKLGLRVSPRTVRKYLLRRLNHGRQRHAPSKRWLTFMRNHAKEIVTCHFCVMVTATFRLLSVFVIIEHAMRRILYINVTAQPTVSWTLQQLHNAIPADHAYRFLMHDRDAIFSQEIDQRVRHLGLRILKTPVRRRQANTLCQRLRGTLRRECLDFLIPLIAHHLQCFLQEWVQHYNERRPAMSLGPGIRQPLWSLPVPLQAYRHRLPEHLCVVTHQILGGLHHDYRLKKKAV
jgi:putative transposase